MQYVCMIDHRRGSENLVGLNLIPPLLILSICVPFSVRYHPSGCVILRTAGVLNEDLDPRFRGSTTGGEEVIVCPETPFGYVL